MRVLYPVKLSSISGVRDRTASRKGSDRCVVKPNPKIRPFVQRVHRNVEKERRERQDNSQDTA